MFPASAFVLILSAPYLLLHSINFYSTTYSISEVPVQAKCHLQFPLDVRSLGPKLFQVPKYPTAVATLVGSKEQWKMMAIENILLLLVWSLNLKFTFFFFLKYISSEKKHLLNQYSHKHFQKAVTQNELHPWHRTTNYLIKKFSIS